MARTRTLTLLLGDLRYVSDSQGLLGRHTDTSLTRLLNQSIQRLREKVSANGITHFLVSTSTPTMTVGPTAPYHFGVIDFSAVSPNVVRVYGIDVTRNGSTYELDGVPFTARNDYQDGDGARNGPPVAFANFQTAKVAIFPPSDSAYSYVAWYLPVLADLASGSDTFDGVAGWEEWVLWDCLPSMVTRDTHAAVIQLIESRRAELWTDIVRGSHSVNRKAAPQRRDTWGESARKRAFSRERLP